MRPLEVAARPVGWIAPDWTSAVLDSASPFRIGDTATVSLDPTLRGFDDRTRALAGWATMLHQAGRLPGWRGEQVLVQDAHGETLAAIERALLRPLGLVLRSVQVNVYGPGRHGPVVWVARRSARKPVDPGRLDGLVGGGVTGFDSDRQTLIRECAEEAGIPEHLAEDAVAAGHLDSCRIARDDGHPVLHRERIALFDLMLPAGFVPRPVDGEHQSIAAMRPAEAALSIAAGGWTTEGGLATLAFLRRRGWLPSNR